MNRLLALLTLLACLSVVFARAPAPPRPKPAKQISPETVAAWKNNGFLLRWVGKDHDTGVTEEGLRRLHKALPKCRVTK